MSASLELEIKALLDELGQPAAVAERLIPFVEGSEDAFTTTNVVTLSRFLLHAGLYHELLSFVLRHLDRPGFRIPWPYFLEAIALSRPNIDDLLADTLLEGIEATDEMAEASRSRALDMNTPALKIQHADRKLQIIKGYRRQKDQMIEQLVTLRTQQLYEREKQQLAKLQRMYPGDPDVERETRNHRERYALEVLAKHSRLSKAAAFDPGPDPEVEKLKAVLAVTLLEKAAEIPSLAGDLAIAASMLDLHEIALATLDLSLFRQDWLRLELLLNAGRFVEVLSEIPAAEHKYAAEPETFFATAYLRAQALWGLGQRHAAIEVMEALLAARPQYRAGVSLLSLWRGQ